MADSGRQGDLFTNSPTKFQLQSVSEQSDTACEHALPWAEQAPQHTHCDTRQGLPTAAQVFLLSHRSSCHTGLSTATRSPTVTQRPGSSCYKAFPLSHRSVTQAFPLSHGSSHCHTGLPTVTQVFPLSHRSSHCHTGLSHMSSLCYTGLSHWSSHCHTGLPTVTQVFPLSHRSSHCHTGLSHRSSHCHIDLPTVTRIRYRRGSSAHTPSRNLDDPGVKGSVSREEDLSSIPAFSVDLFPGRHTSDMKIGTPVATAGRLS